MSRSWVAAILFAPLLALALLLLRLLTRPSSPPNLKLPPRPSPSLPLLGDLLHLRKLQSSMQSLRDKLGPIFTLYVGSTPIVCITSAALAHEALVQNGRLFAGRPLLRSRIIFSNNYRNISSAPYGPYWRTMRRNLVQEMLAMPKVLGFQPFRLLTLEKMISCVQAEAECNAGSVSVYPIIKNAIFELLLFMCFGFHMPKEDALQISGLMDEIIRYATGNLQDFYSCLHIFYEKKHRKGLVLRAKQMQIFAFHFERHHQLREQGELCPGSYLETLLHMDAGVTLTSEDMVTLCTEFLAAATDSSATALEWAMAHVAEDSSIQSKLYAQLSDVVGNAPLEEKHLPRLPYLQALIKETLRLHPPTHFLLPHNVSEVCNVGGYEIPPDAIVMFHIMSISKDPETWEKPLNFKPERFLSSDMVITGPKDLSMLPFGAGRRICPGLGLAFLHMELFVAGLVQAFKWSVSPSRVSFEATDSSMFTVRMKHPLQALVKGRKGVLC